MRRILRAVPAALALPFLVLSGACSFGEPEEVDVPTVIDAWEYSTTSAAARAEMLRAEDRWDMDAEHAAYEHAQAAIALDPMWGYAYLLAAQAAPGFEEFRANLRRAIENSAGATPAERLLIEAAQRAFDGDADGELESLQALLALDTTNARAHVWLGWAYAGRNRDDEARSEFRKATQLEPEMGTGYYSLVFNLITEEPVDFAAAEAAMARLLELEPDEAGIHDLHGDLRRAQGRLAEARDAYTRSFELDTTRALALQQRGHVNTFLGEYDAARADYAAARDRARDNDIATFERYRAYTYVYEGRPDVALAALEQLITDMPTLGVASVDGQTIGTLIDIVSLAAYTDRLAVARDALARAIPMMRRRAQETGTPEFTAGTEQGIALWEGYLAYQAGDEETALAKAAEAMRLVATQRNPRRDEYSHSLMGLVALRRGRAAEAVAHFEQANDDDMFMLYHHGLALEAAGRNDEAMAIFRQIADYRFNNLGVALVKGEAQRRVAQAAAT